MLADESQSQVGADFATFPLQSNFSMRYSGSTMSLLTDVVSRMSPIAQCVQVAKVQTLLHAKGDFRNSARYLPCHKRPSSPRRLVIEQDTIRSVHTVRLAVVFDDPKAV